MIKKYIFLIMVMLICSSHGPPNCNLYKKNKDCYRACKEAERAIKFRQGTRFSQKYFDQSIERCPSFAYSYYEKAVPYAKRGQIKEWKILIDKAVTIDPIEYLPFRGWYHFFFMHNYESTIADINKLDSLMTYDIGVSGDGLYHLNILKALAFKGLGKKKEALSILQQQINSKDHYQGLYDYLHLGVLYLENNEFQAAIEALDKQKEVNDISELYYYKAIAFKHLGVQKMYKTNLNRALEYYKKDKKMMNPYRQLPDEIFQLDIEKEMEIVNKEIILFIDAPNDLSSCINASQLNVKYESVSKKIKYKEDYRFTVLPKSERANRQIDQEYLLCTVYEMNQDSITFNIELLKPEVKQDRYIARFGKSKKPFSCDFLQEMICSFYLK